MQSRVAFYTLGCKLNFSETSTIGTQFVKRGFQVVDFKDEADVYVINTCSVTDSADKECRQIVRRALRLNPNAFIAVTGCYAQLKPEEIASIDGVDVVLGSNEKFKLFDYINDFTKRELSCIHVSPTDELNEINGAFSSDATGRTRAFLKIQDGCDYTCSYCTIPLARGKSRSLKPEEVLENFKALLDEGYKEIIITGVNVGDYGKAFNMDFYSLLLKMVEVPGDFRLRISSIEPNLLTDEILELTLNNKKMCRHFHIPLQSGSPKVLRLMQRRYKQENYRKLINRVIEKIPDAGIGVDVIVGFPGETEDDFMDTYNFLKELPVSYLHVFTYSERPNTKAINFEGVVNHTERKRRNNMLRILSEKKRNEFYRKMAGNELEILFEHENHDGHMKGFASNYVRVQHEYDGSLVNVFSHVRIESVEGEICFGKVVNE
ncbi:MAG: tRNA (N(6)-L-threonylcarbamoyladenosine(37)-C(2))-methylthiotransferase MtaB [Bacteroidota bacterium]|nr:tRNA (N(6)-L-threonylcarbamoyladenosine(37)-C(2))-methylthiotransferase MtaB [Ignavibacteria bacterium]MCU7500430.1 tRNA (N(6)-L-threonylcarbamoyladenosine(37)-C(2))-methylthiotransferase MtaB [Ignavibacteria bacterium]MCU7521816.1 tRNA (N(6)-L-threonylcarbamoyladenosine(37)-C(2))-methylthiotransferase MtaB [Ignavibacteria bacterium]MCU7525974.1 tRNA (N(6)-L-threonylcarbamoyladenosine(37)-C(2))-methylthiotransferase MtaB [Ignavibacteria bacterium]